MSFLNEDELSHIWENAKNILPELQNARIFITGGTGFFGSWLLESLRFAKQNFGLKLEVVVLSRDLSKFFNKMPHLFNLDFISFCHGDVKTFTFPQGHFTHLIHAATEASAELNLNQPQNMINTIVAGTQRVLQFAEERKIKKILFVSSGAVYGRQPTELSHMPETYPGSLELFSLQSAYSMGKQMAEHLCYLSACQHHLEIKIARCFAFVGPYLPLNTHFAIGNFIANALKQEEIQVFGDGTAFRSYLYAADLIVWLLTILCLGESCLPYNVGSKHEITIAELAHLIASTREIKLPVRIAKQAILDRPEQRYVPCTKRAYELLNLRETISLQEAIQRTLIWNLNHARY
jgi:nucleoside-diphosphate-sugar epimerase